jgi:hypothetical protein
MPIFFEQMPAFWSNGLRDPCLFLYAKVLIWRILCFSGILWGNVETWPKSGWWCHTHLLAVAAENGNCSAISYCLLLSPIVPENRWRNYVIYWWNGKALFIASSSLDPKRIIPSNLNCQSFDKFFQQSKYFLRPFKTSTICFLWFF